MWPPLGALGTAAGRPPPPEMPAVRRPSHGGNKWHRRHCQGGCSTDSPSPKTCGIPFPWDLLCNVGSTSSSQKLAQAPFAVTGRQQDGRQEAVQAPTQRAVPHGTSCRCRRLSGFPRPLRHYPLACILRGPRLCSTNKGVDLQSLGNGLGRDSGSPLLFPAMCTQGGKRILRSLKMRKQARGPRTGTRAPR